MSPLDRAVQIRWTAPIVLVVLVVACGGVANDGDASGSFGAALGAREGPSGSAFWRVPVEAPAGTQRGDVLWVRERTDAPMGSRGWNLIYVSEGATGALVYVSGEVYAPDSPPEAASRPLVIWNHGTAGTQDSCAPSRNNLALGSEREGDRLASDGDSRAPALVSLLERGYVVAMSDYQGLGTPGGTEYLNGPSQGRAALDVARAARNLTPLGAGEQVAMYGFSQGGQTSLWAAHLAPTYAPELDLRGVVAIAPAARQLALSFYDLDIPENAGYFIARMAGLAVGHPELRLRDMLTPAGLEMLDAQTWDCFEIFRQASGMTEPYAYPKALEPGTAWRRRLEANDAFLPIASSIPVLVIQGDADVDVGVELTRDVVRDLCAGGTLVEYQEHPGVNHLDMNVRAAPQVADWVAARFADETARSTCAGNEPAS
ncbi:MAG: lipase [Acidobacteria bacterium]|nr:lipase [Acidobacteriota bacterium]